MFAQCLCPQTACVLCDSHSFHCDIWSEESGWFVQEIDIHTIWHSQQYSCDCIITTLNI